MKPLDPNEIIEKSREFVEKCAENKDEIAKLCHDGNQEKDKDFDPVNFGGPGIWDYDSKPLEVLRSQIQSYIENIPGRLNCPKGCKGQFKNTVRGRIEGRVKVKTPKCKDDQSKPFAWEEKHFAEKNCREAERKAYEWRKSLLMGKINPFSSQTGSCAIYETSTLTVTREKEKCIIKAHVDFYHDDMRDDNLLFVVKDVSVKTELKCEPAIGVAK